MCILKKAASKRQQQILTLRVTSSPRNMLTKATSHSMCKGLVWSNNIIVAKMNIIIWIMIASKRTIIKTENIIT